MRFYESGELVSFAVGSLAGHDQVWSNSIDKVDPWQSVKLINGNIMSTSALLAWHWPLEQYKWQVEVVGLAWSPCQWCCWDWRVESVSFLKGWRCLYSLAKWRDETYNFHILSGAQNKDIWPPSNKTIQYHATFPHHQTSPATDQRLLNIHHGPLRAKYIT